jgi:hypothetical protein
MLKRSFDHLVGHRFDGWVVRGFTTASAKTRQRR